LSMSSLGPDVGRLEKSRQASFMLAGVVAAKTPEAGQRTHDTVKKICESIMHAYEVANDSNANRAAKIQAIQAVADLGPELDWLLSFTKEEAEWCRFPAERGEMMAIHSTLQGQTSVLKNSFRGLRVDVERFSDVFDTLLALLEETTAFLRLGHAAECARVKDALDNAYGEVRNLAHCELASLLVDQAKLASTRVNDAWKAIDSLVKVQPGLNDSLVPRVDQVDSLLRKALPELILRTRDVVTRGGAAKSEQAHAHTQLVACLDELKRILSQVSANYVNQFDESATRVPLEYDPLESALKGVVKALADLKGAQMTHEPEMIQMQLADLIPEFVKVAVAELARLKANDNDKREFIDAVKRARDGDMNDFFAAQDKFNEIKDRIKNRPQIQIGLVEDNTVSKSKDLLKAAKDMCHAMSKLNIAMDE